jgi:hypothetical protein
MVYCQMLFALAFDKLVFGTTPSALSILGSSLILGSAIYVALHKPDPSKEDGARANAEEELGLMNPHARVRGNDINDNADDDDHDDNDDEREPRGRISSRIL